MISIFQSTFFKNYLNYLKIKQNILVAVLIRREQFWHQEKKPLNEKIAHHTISYMKKV